jgi:hypothetical protein
MKRLFSVSVLSLFLVSVFVFSGYCFDDDSYNTPDHWSQHITSGRIVQSMEGVGLTPDTSLYTTLTTRLKLKSNDYAEDNDVYQYVRMHTDSVALGKGTVKFSIYGRIADDIDGYSDKQWGEKYYYSQRDILDSEQGDDTVAGRLYQGYANFDGVIEKTNLKVGRFYVDHVNSFQVDGGDLTVNVGEYLDIYAYGGLPVSYFYDLDDSSLYGIGGVARLGENTKVKAEYTSMDIQDIEDDYTEVRLIQIIPGGNVMLGYKNLNDSDTFSADVDYGIAATNTIITFSYEKLNDDITSDKTYVTNPITYALMDQSKYSKYKASIYQAFMKYFVLGASYESKSVDGDENFDNRDFNKFGFKFDINGLPTKDTYISFTADKWDISSTSESDDNDRIYYGVQFGQKVADKVDLWLGTSFSRYEYDYLTDKRKDSVRSYYVGCDYQHSDTFGLMVDVSREDTDFYDDIDDDLSKSYIVELWANLSF